MAGGPFVKPRSFLVALIRHGTPFSSTPSLALLLLSQQIAMRLRRVRQMHECVLVGPQREDSRVREEGRSQGRDRSALRGRSRYGQTLLQATRRARHPGAEKGSRQETQARRESYETSCTRPRRKAVGYPLPESRVPVGHLGGEGKRSDGLPGGRTSA